MSYSNKVLDHYENPRNVGTFEKDDVGVGTGMVGAPACGDVMRLQIKVDNNGVIEDARFKTYGCGSAIASSSTPGRCSRTARSDAHSVATPHGPQTVPISWRSEVARGDQPAPP